MQTARGIRSRATKSWYLQYFNTEEILDYLGSIRDISYYSVEEMIGVERNEFLVRYYTQV